MPTSEETKDKVAKVGFMAFMAAAMGPVGILVAALSVGISEAIDGDGGRGTSEDLTRQQVADQRQWLAEDRAFRERLRADRAKWLADGAKPELEPARPSTGEMVGRWWRRLWARMVVFADDFKRGFRDGWAAAKEAHRDGADWRETARTRPVPKPEPEPADADDPTVGTPADEPDPNPDETPLADVIDLRKTPDPKPDPNTSPDSSDEGEEHVTSPTGSAPKGESNVSVLREMLRRIGGNITKVEAGVDDLSALADALAAQVREATEFATRTGQIGATKAALDAANAVVQRLKQLVIAASQAAVEAVDQVASARGSLKVAESAEDALTAAGGTGDAVATAKAA